MKLSQYMPTVPWGMVAKSCFSNLHLGFDSEIFPLIQVNSPQIDPLTLKPQYPLKRYIHLVSESICDSFDDDAVFAVDHSFASSDPIQKQSAYSYFLHLLWSNNRAAVPVLSNLSSHSENSRLIRELGSKLHAKNVVKYAFKNRGVGAEDLRFWLSEVLDMLGESGEGTDLVLDLGYVGGWSHTNAVDGVVEWIRIASEVAPWSSIVLSSTSISSGFCAQSSFGFPVIRNEWILYREVKRRLGQMSALRFGDNAIFGAGLSCVANANQACQILPYTLDNSFFVFSRLNVRHDSHLELQKIFSELMTYPGVYKGRDYSYGDAVLQMYNDSAALSPSTSDITQLLAALLDHHLKVSLESIRRE